MRGTLTHHYTCDERGICTSANLIVGTTNNNAPDPDGDQEGRAGAIKPGVEPDQGLLNMVEMAFRAFDPCYSCATHSLGKMPLEAALYKRGELVKTIKRTAEEGTEMLDVDELKCCHIFDDLNDRELEEVAKLGTIEKRRAGSRIIAEGTNAGALCTC